MSHSPLIHPDYRFNPDGSNEKLLKEVREKFFIKFTGCVISCLANQRSLSLIRRNPISALKHALDPYTHIVMSNIIGFNIRKIDVITAVEERKQTMAFLIEGVVNTLSELLARGVKELSAQELTIVNNFRNAKTPEGNGCTIENLKEILEKHFSSPDSNGVKNTGDTTFRTRESKGGRKTDLRDVKTALILKKDNLHNTIIGERLGVNENTIGIWVHKFTLDDAGKVILKP